MTSRKSSSQTACRRISHHRRRHAGRLAYGHWAFRRRRVLHLRRHHVRRRRLRRRAGSRPGHFRLGCGRRRWRFDMKRQRHASGTANAAPEPSRQRLSASTPKLRSRQKVSVRHADSVLACGRTAPSVRPRAERALRLSDLGLRDLHRLTTTGSARTLLWVFSPGRPNRAARLLPPSLSPSSGAGPGRFLAFPHLARVAAYRLPNAQSCRRRRLVACCNATRYGAGC